MKILLHEKVGLAPAFLFALPFCLRCFSAAACCRHYTHAPTDLANKPLMV
jgi:hypothetical protein